MCVRVVCRHPHLSVCSDYRNDWCGARVVVHVVWERAMMNRGGWILNTRPQRRAGIPINGIL